MGRKRLRSAKERLPTEGDGLEADKALCVVHQVIL